MAKRSGAPPVIVPELRPVANNCYIQPLMTCLDLLRLWAPNSGLVLLLLGPFAGSGRSAEVKLYRDEFGIPHVFAGTLPEAAYAVGYAQAEDRLEELLKNYRRAAGTMSEVFGPDHYRDDVAQRLFQHAAISRKYYVRLDPAVRAVIERFQDGIRQFMKEHPDKVPSWAHRIEPWEVVALGRYIIYGWPAGEAGADLERAGIAWDDHRYRGSNEILIGPARTSMGVPIAIIDPHLSWYGEFRFYQVRIYAGEYTASGVTILGTPLPALGHNRYCSVAMTTGGPDTSDIYEEELNPANPRQYLYDGQWKEMEIHRERIGVKKAGEIDWRIVENEYTDHGPVVAHRPGKAYAMAIPYAQEAGLMAQTHQMMMARNLNEMKKALSQLQLMGQNVMVGTVQGDIYYVRNGRVPVRAPGLDTQRPIPGSSSSNEWRGLHPFSDLVQMTNPPQGYMHNNNVTPFGMMKESPLTPEAYARYPYLYNAGRGSPRHQRGEMMTELLDRAKAVTLEDALDLAFNLSSSRIEQKAQ